MARSSLWVLIPLYHPCPLLMLLPRLNILSLASCILKLIDEVLVVTDIAIGLLFRRWSHLPFPLPPLLPFVPSPSPSPSHP